MTLLITHPNIVDPDSVYQRLVDLHEGLDDAGSHAMNARLIFILLNHIGDAHIIDAAFAAAQQRS